MRYSPEHGMTWSVFSGIYYICYHIMVYKLDFVVLEPESKKDSEIPFLALF